MQCISQRGASCNYTAAPAGTLSLPGSEGDPLALRRTAPFPTTNPLTSGTVSELSSTAVMPGTMETKNCKQQLLVALANLAQAQPPEPFANEFIMSGEVVEGGQAVVAFARDSRDGFGQYAIKCALSFRPVRMRCVACAIVTQPAALHTAAAAALAFKRRTLTRAGWPQVLPRPQGV
jgi:hypothetical protein